MLHPDRSALRAKSPIVALRTECITPVSPPLSTTHEDLLCQNFVATRERQARASHCIFAMLIQHLVQLLATSKYMDEEEDVYAHYSQKVVQQVLAALAPNVEDVVFSRTKLVQGRVRTNMVPQGTGSKLLEKDTFSCPRRLRRLVITASRDRGVELTEEELKGWHRHGDFSCLRTLVLSAPLDRGALRWLRKCSLASLKDLTCQLHDNNNAESERAMYHAKEFGISLPSLSKLFIRDFWRMLPSCINAILLRHGASLRSLGLYHRTGISVRSATRILKSMQGLCPKLTELALHILREQGSIRETRLYQLFAGLPSLRCLMLTLIAGGGLASNNTFGDYRMIFPGRSRRHDDDFDQQTLDGVTGNHNPRYGDIRRAFTDKAIDEDFARNVYRLGCAPNRPRSLKGLVVVSEPYFFFDAQRVNSPIREVFSHICRSWTVQPGVRDDMPDELVVREMDRHREIKVEPAPEKLDPRVEQIFRRIWPGNEDGTSDWRTDWHSFLACEEGIAEAEKSHAGQS